MNPIPFECTDLATTLDQLRVDLKNLQEELRKASPNAKGKITEEIRKTQADIKKADANLNRCIKEHSGPPIPASTKANISTDTSPALQTKVISLGFLQQKFDEFFNKRMDLPLFQLRLDHYFDSPNSHAEFLFIDAELGYKQIGFADLGELDFGYSFNDINSNFINVNLNLSEPAPLEVKITFETGGKEEMTSTDFTTPNLNFLDFSITLKFTLDFDTHGKVDLLSWVTDLSKLSEDEFEDTLPKFVNVHIQADGSDFRPGGIVQKKMREKIFNRLADPGDPAKEKPSTRDSFNKQINTWLLGGDGNYKITSFSNDGQTLTLTYEVPKNVVTPFSLDWPPSSDTQFKPELNFSPSVSSDNTQSNPWPDFSPGVLANIDHIVVLTMENRSFDQMLGYLSLPIKSGGMGRAEVDGLKGGEFNPFLGVNYPSFPFPPGKTQFAPDPGHGFGSTFHQIDGGKMDGFVHSFAEEKVREPSKASSIMGYHTGINVPVYDALARDFAIGHRWFAAHPGPTFCNRFYELTGRLNLASGLSHIPDRAKGYWELNNSKPLTPVFTKTIFDFLMDYQHINSNLTWAYYEHGYCFLRFFEAHTFDHTNIVDVNDPARGFFANARRGTLPSVSFIDPHFIEMPPNANCDGPVADVKDGQELVQKIVEAVVAGPKWNKTLLIIIYDEHGGFYDHVPPPQAVPFSNEPVKTYGVRVPAFVISPWVKPGQVFGHDAPAGTQNSLYFDHTSILKTIARRFMSDHPPYLGPRYAAAHDLTAVLGNTLRKSQFLPFIRYNLMYTASQKMLDVQDGNPAPGTPLQQLDKKEGSSAQNFSFEDAGNGFMYIRTHSGNLYITANVSDGGTTIGGGVTAPSSGHGIKQDVKYKSGSVITGSIKFNPDYQKWKLTPVGTTIFDKDLYMISNAAFPNTVLQPINAESGGAVVLVDYTPSKGIVNTRNVWKVSSPMFDGLSQTPASPTPISEAELVTQLEKLAKTNPAKLNWKVSIVDLLKLLKLDSSYEARKKLAVKLGSPVDLRNGSAKMNVWLHKTVLKRIAQNGGNIPNELLN